MSSATAVAVAKAAKVLACPVVLSVPARCIVALVPNTLSDTLFCLPALAALRESFPGAHLCAVARPALVPLLSATRLADEVLERRKGGLSAQASLLLRLHAAKPDIAVAFSSGRNAVLLAWSSGAPLRAGFEEAKMEALLTHRVPRNGPPRTEAFLELARSLGCKTPHLDYRGLLDPGPHAIAQAQSLLDEAGVSGRFLLAAPASPDARSIAEWPLELWARTLASLAPAWPVVLVGPAPQPRLAKACAGLPVFDLGGRADLLALAALCGKSSGLVGTEGGLLHLAAAMQRPVVGIFGPGDARRIGPRGEVRLVTHPVECSPCGLARCALSGDQKRKCLSLIAPDSVAQAARELFGV
jgi:ADP-heptose:LPS heptosyltransferase